MPYLAVAGGVVIGLVFLVSGVTKLLDPPAFTRSVAQLRVLPGPVVRPVAVTVMVTEAAVPLLLALPFVITRLAGAAVAIGLLISFSVAIAVSLRRGQSAPCRCFGRSQTPLGPQHLVRNSALVLVAAVTAAAVTVGGPAQPAGLLVAGVAGAVVALLVVMLDDIVALVRPAPVGDRPAAGGR